MFAVADPPEILLFLGRFHPLLVHLPIGFLLLAFLLEVCSRRPRFAGYQPAVSFALFLGAGSAVLSAGLGYLLALGGDYDAEVLSRHQWLGIGVAGAAVLAVFLRTRRQRLASRWQDRLYVWTLLLTVVLLMGAGHYGGSLTHGSDYLTTYLPAPLQSITGTTSRKLKVRPITNLPEAVVYTDIIQPIFDARCTGCHNPAKKKGGLRLDDHIGLLAGGKGGAVLQPGLAAGSELYKRLLLPPEDKHAMPPKGKEPLTESELQLIGWWINNGADPGKKVKQLAQNPTIRTALANRVAARQQAVNPVFTRSLSEAPATALQAAEQAGFLVIPWAKGQPYLRAQRKAGAPAPKNLAALKPLAGQLVALDLGGSSLSDSILATIGTFSNLTQLHLENTGTSDKGLAALVGLPYLEYLNLYGNPVTDKGLAVLTRNRRLRKLYVWQTRVTDGGVAAIRAKLPQLAVYTGIQVN